MSFIRIVVALLLFGGVVHGQANQTVISGSQTASVVFPSNTCGYKWTNDKPGIGLTAAGYGNIASFTAVNNTNASITATITATPANAAYAYIANKLTLDLSVVNTATNTVVTTINMGDSPLSVAISPDGTRTYVELKAGNVAVIDNTTFKIIATITMHAYGSMLFNSTGTRLYVISYDDQGQEIISVINTSTNAILNVFALIKQVSTSALFMAISPDGKTLYISGNDNTVGTLDLTTGTERVAGFGYNTPYGMVISPDGTKLYTTFLSQNILVVLDAVTDSVLAQVPVQNLSKDLAISPDGSKIYLCNLYNNNITVVSTATNTVVANISAGSYHEGISITPDGNFLYAENYSANTVSVISTATNTVVATINVGAGPNSFGGFIGHGIACSGATIKFTITVEAPAITVGAVTGAISACTGSVSANPNISQFTVSGSTLTNNIIATAPAGFEISLNATAGYGNNLSFPPTTVPTIVYVRSAASAIPASLSGNIVLTSAGASPQSVAVTGIVNNPPVAAFTVITAVCANSPLAFKDASSVAAGNTEKSWLWDFGDGQTSTVQNPAHTYLAGGNYNTRLTVTDNIGCTSVSTITAIQVTGAPVANFTTSAPACPGENIVFTDRSSAANGTIKQWNWDFGDGTKSTLTNNQPFTHTYNVSGIDTVKLTVVTDLGCTSTVYALPITITPLPVTDFALPDVCLNDAYAQFNDQSTIADNTQSAFTYAWNFGDANSTAANNTSTQQNPRHKYNQTGNYTATLTVTSKYGCATTKSKTFTVNGATPKGAFTVENQNALCSKDSIVFDDQSTVDFGDITKLVWFFDYNNNPKDSVVYDISHLHANKKYTHYYGLNNTTNSKTYQVQLFAYSGQTCFSPVQQNVTVNPNPVAVVLPKDSVTLCHFDNPLQFTGTSNIAGTGVYSGVGVSAGGLFNPKMAGTGTFIVHYVFTSAATGCTDSVMVKVRVNPNPVVSSSTQLLAIEGASVTLDAKASGTDGAMTYRWLPDFALSDNRLLNPVASPTADITYTLTATSSNGCTATTSILVKVLKAPIVANTFTPNGDGINDKWDILYLDQYPNATVEVFNRYGQRIYFSRNYPTPWDGTNKNTALPAGTYYYIINPNSGRKVLSGHVTIIR